MKRSLLILSMIILGFCANAQNLVVTFTNSTTELFPVAVDLGRAIEYDFTIYDAVGQSLYRKEGLTGHINEISLAGDVSPGTYTIRLTTKEGLTGVSKLVIQ